MQEQDTENLVMKASYEQHYPENKLFYVKNTGFGFNLTKWKKEKIKTLWITYI